MATAEPSTAYPWNRGAGGGLDTVVVMGERNQRVTGSAWRGGRVLTVMGQAHVDLREAALFRDGARLRATAVMGSVKLEVPEGWSVSVKGTPVLGSVEDRTETSSTPRRGRAHRMPTVEILATAVLGEVEINH